MPPYFIGLGAQKSGTTSVDLWLRQHPEIFIPPKKELHYFSLHYGKGAAWYQQQFKEAAPNQRCGEFTPYYLFHPLVPARIIQDAPQAKLIILLRDPIERTISQYNHSRRLGLEDLPLEQALAAEASRLSLAATRIAAGECNRSHQEHSYLERSRYEIQITRYRELFPSEQMLIIRIEQLYANPMKYWTLLLNFLNVGWQPMPQLQHANQGISLQKAPPQEIDSWLRQKLAPTYRWLAQENLS